MFDLNELGATAPILQSPMAGVATPELAAAVCAAGGIGGLGLGSCWPEQAQAQLARVAQLTKGPINANFFCHQPPRDQPDLARRWLDRLSPLFTGDVPARLTRIYPEFQTSDDLLHVVVQARPAIASFHFGLPNADQVRALKGAGICLLASATSVAEAELAKAAGMDAIVAQGWQAGGHRGIFDPEGPDERLETLPLCHRLRGLGLPVIAAGGLMTGADIRAALNAGAVAAQLGTAFILCPESAANPAYRAALQAVPEGGTDMVRVISGRPARSLPTPWMQVADADMPDYPLPYDAAKALAAQNPAYGAQWAGTGAHLAQQATVAQVMVRLLRELDEA